MAEDSTYIGKTFFYRTASGKLRSARCTQVSFDERLGKTIYHGTTRFNHELRLTPDEIYQWER